MAWANSADRLGNKPLPYVVLDEEDKYPVRSGKREASPAALAKKRTRTFAHMRKDHTHGRERAHLAGYHRKN